MLGVGVAALMIRVLSSVFSGFYKGITLQFHVDWTSLVIAVCAGILLTFVVVAFSAYKVSRLNIVAAIRDLDESEQRDAGMLEHVHGAVRSGLGGAQAAAPRSPARVPRPHHARARSEPSARSGGPCSSAVR